MAATPSAQAGSARKNLDRRILWLVIATLVMVVILLLPTPASLPVVGHRALAILAFAVILWVTEAVSYPVSAALIIGLISLLLGLSPNPDAPGKLLGTKSALSWALGGFSNSAGMLVAGALFLSVAMQVTRLDKRIALLILSKVGSRTRAVLIGSLLVGIVLAFFVPSTTARVGAIVPIMLGMVSAFGMEKTSRFAALLMIATTQVASIWNIGVKTAAAQNMVAIGFMEEAFGITVTWVQWLLYAAPWAAIMTVILYFILLKVLPPEVEEIPNGQEMIREQLATLGPVTPAEKRLIVIAAALLFLWATEGIVHPLDTTTTTLAAVAIMLTPGIGVMNWKQAEELVPWGTIVMFCVGISLGTTLLRTNAASWLADAFIAATGLKMMPVLAMIALLSLFNIVIHFGFASATSLSSTLIPVVIAMMTSMNRPDVPPMAMVLIQQFVVSFGFILPVNAPQNMLAYGTGTFTARDLMKTGVPLTIAGYLLILLFAATYWKWVGLL